MGAFEYAALDVRGRTQRGVLEADTPRQIRQQLRERGFTPLSVDEVAGQERRVRGQMRAVRTADLALVMRQLAILERSGLPLEEALRTTARQTDKERLKRVLLGVRAQVLEGQSLAAGFAKFPRVFPNIYRATVEAGEQSGHLGRVLESLAEYSERRQQLRQKTMLALLYPLILTGVALLVVVGLLGYVVPQVVQVFDNIGQELPWLTRALIALSAFIKQWGVLLLIALVVGVIVFRYMLRAEHVRLAVDRFLLRLPIVSRLVRGLNAARFAGTLSVLVGSAVPMLEALRIASTVLTNLPMRRAVEQATQQVSEGTSLHAALEPSGLFPPVTVQLIASGEASGNLDEMLDRAAGNLEMETESYLSILLGVFEPLLILAMGGLVLTIVIAILLPVFELNQLVK